MRHMTQKWITVLPVILLMVGLVAVGCSSDEGEITESVGEEVTGGSSEAPQQETEFPLGVETVKIGLQGARSGGHAYYGRQMAMGATLAMEEINAAGGILGSKVELKIRDSELNGNVAQKNARYFVEEWGADFLVGTDSSGVSLALAPLLKELNTIQIFTHAATEKLTEDMVYKQGIKQVFRISVPVYQDAIMAALVFKDKPEMKRFAALNADYEYGHTSWAMFKETLSKYRDDVEFVEEAAAPFRTTDFTPYLSKLMAAEPDVIFATPWAGEAVMMLKQAKNMGVFNEIDAWWQAMGGSADVLEALSGDIKAGAFQGKLWGTGRYIHNWPDTPENKNFVEAFLGRWDGYPNYSAETAYSAIYALKTAIEKAESIETDPVIAALEGLTIMTPAGERYFRPEDHQAVYNVPAGRAVWDDNYPIAIIGGDLKIVPAEEYYRSPPDYRNPPFD